MAWIESHQTLAGHPKTRKLAHILGINKPQAIGHLHCLWWWAMDYAQDGDLSRHDALDIAIGAEWEDDPDVFVDAMVKVGFIDDDMAIHDWNDYAGKLIERRKANAERMRSARASNATDTTKTQSGDVPDTDNVRSSHVQRTQRARVERPNPTQPNTTVHDQNENTAHARGGADAPSADEPPKAKTRNEPESTPKPRTAKQLESDRKFARSTELFEAYCRGIGIDADSEAADVYRDRAFRELKPVASKPAPDASDMERCTRFLSLQTWRDEPPKIPHVLGGYAGWVAKGKPDAPEGQQSNITPFQSGKRPPGRRGFSADELMESGLQGMKGMNR